MPDWVEVGPCVSNWGIFKKYFLCLQEILKNRESHSDNSCVVFDRFEERILIIIDYSKYFMLVFCSIYLNLYDIYMSLYMASSSCIACR